MQRIAPFAIVIGIVAITSPAALHAQRGRHAPPPHTPSHTTPAPPIAPPITPPITPPIPSADHPLPYNFNAVKPAPLLGRDPIPAPFSVPPGYYNRQHPFANIPYGYGYGYGYAAPDDGATSAPPPLPPPVVPATETSRSPADAPPPTPLPAPVAPYGPRTMYVIPGCYGGNTPPVQANLPKGCDIARVRVLRPPQ